MTSEFSYQLKVVYTRFDESLYENMSREILKNNNNRILVFHDSCVCDCDKVGCECRNIYLNKFIDNKRFKNIFNDVKKKEFSENNIYKKIKMINLNPEKKNRENVWEKFYNTKNDEVIIISSWEHMAHKNFYPENRLVLSRPLIGGTMCVFDKSDLTFLDIKNCLISNYLVNAEYECGMVFYRDKEGLLKFNYSSCLPIHDININYHYDFIEQNSGSIFKTKNDPNTALQQKPLKSMKLKKSSTKEIKEPEESIKQKRERVKSEISILHQRYKTMKSDNLSKEFIENPDLWHKYHEISEENEKSFPENEIPRNRIIEELNKIKTKRSKLIVDMGCGKGQISQYFQNDKRFQFINYDHISSNDTIISCDISKTPLENDSVEICILSLAMWGSNCREYIEETYRILETGGNLYIIEPTKRWSEQDETGNIIPEKEGLKLNTLLEENGFKIIQKNIEKFCLFNCIKI